MSSSKRVDKSSDTPDIPTGLHTKPTNNPIWDYVINPFRDQMPTTLMSRKAFSKAGKQAVIQLNSHVVEQWPTIDVSQYDVSLLWSPTFSSVTGQPKVVVGSGDEKRGLIAAVWGSKKVKSEIARYGAGFIFDMNRIGW